MYSPKLLFLAACSLLLGSCSVSRKLNKEARLLTGNEALKTAHIGISIYEPATGKWWYNYQGDKYFVPASNTKIATCYAAMKYLGDSLVAARIATDEQGRLRVFPAGDPTFLHQEFSFQPLMQRMKGFKSIFWSLDGWKEQHWGSGWTWNDYDAAYMAERSPFPIYGNIASFRLVNGKLQIIPATLSVEAASEIGYDKQKGTVSLQSFRVDRSLNENDFTLRKAAIDFSGASLPIRTDAGYVSTYLSDTLKAEVVPSTVAPGYSYKPVLQIIKSQPTDSLLKPMMHRSDNFFAEQSLLMVSNEVLGYMSDEKIIDTILKTDFKDLPHKPRWTDGSGLSRYNLFTPQDFVVILNKIKTDFGMKRIKEVFPTGNEGTLTNYYKTDSSYLYAKTGTLSGVVALSGFLTTVKGKDLIFSVLVNNHQASGPGVRRAVEKFIQNLRKDY